MSKRKQRNEGLHLEQAILKLSQIKELTNDVIMRSKKMDQILESINNSNPYIKDITTFIDISDVRYGAELLIANIEDALDDIEKR